MMFKAIILIAGPGKGTRFRPLSLDVPKPLFSVAGVSMIEHHIEACSQIPEIKEILLIGFYPLTEMNSFVQEMSLNYKINIRYLQEFTALGTAGGIHHFRDQIRSGNPDAFFVLNGDVCADFPLKQLLKFHVEDDSGALVSIMATEATKQQSLNYGCIVEDPANHSILHYVEKPTTYVSHLINCGVYIFSPEIFPLLRKVFDKNQSSYYSDADLRDGKNETIWLERDILTPLAGTGKSRVYTTTNWWSQIKTAGSAIYANRHYLNLYDESHPERLAKNTENGPKIIGHVFIHPNASVHPSAVLGPNVSIGKNVTVSAGARIRESIILGNSCIGEHSLVLHTVVGWNSKVGNWSRVEGTPNDPNPNKPFAKMDNCNLFNEEGKLNPSITILGSDVVVPSEIILLNSIVLPHKNLSQSVKNEILL